MKDGIIFNVQHYAVHDGPGIRTIVFFKGCPLSCAWCCNPESQLFFPQLRNVDFRCKKCFSCIDVCPKNAVSTAEGIKKILFDICGSCELKPCIENCNYSALQVSGKKYSVSEVIEIISKDIPFYKNSGGGVTFSGGEPFAQPEFLYEILLECNKRNIHTVVETCGWCRKKDIEKSMDIIDLFLYDLKLMDDNDHIKLTGKSNKIILENLKFLASEKDGIIIRFPLIPGITDTYANLKSVADFMITYQLKNISIEPYHILGTEKYAEHGMEYSLETLKPYYVPQIVGIKNFFLEKGLICESE